MNQICRAASGLVIFVNVVFGSDIDDVSIVASAADEGINAVATDEGVAIGSANEGVHADFSEKSVGTGAAVQRVDAITAI